MTCAFGTVLSPIQVPDSATKTLPVVPGTKLVTDRGLKSVLTANQETDSRVALSRAVAEYVSLLDFQPQGGRLVRFATVRYEWAEGVDEAVYPAVCVYATGPQKYDANGFTPSIGVSATTKLEGTDTEWLIHTSNLIVNLTVQVYASDPEERMAVVAGLEALFSPVRFMSGFRLDMPHYFGARAEFAIQSLTYEDSADDSRRRWRRATFGLEARGPVLRLEKLRKATIKPDVRVSQGA